MGQPNKNLIVIGSGGHARIVIDIAVSVGYSISGIIDINYDNQKEKILKYPILGNFNIIDQLSPKNHCVIIAIGDGSQRTDYYKKVKRLGYLMPSIVHPSSIISKHVTIGKSVLINAGVIINALGLGAVFYYSAGLTLASLLILIPIPLGVDNTVEKI